MKSSLRLAGAAALCGALLLSACAKKTDQTTTSTDSSQSAASTSAPDASASATPPEVIASSSPDASASTAPSASATTAAMTATTVPVSSATTGTSATAATGTNGASSGGYIDLPVYPGATETKDQAMSVSTNTGSFVTKVYATKDDTKKVADWYKSHLPASFKGGVISSGDKTMGSFADEHTNGEGDQSVIVASQDDKTTRIQLSTKHGK